MATPALGFQNPLTTAGQQVTPNANKAQQSTTAGPTTTPAPKPRKLSYWEKVGTYAAFATKNSANFKLSTALGLATISGDKTETKKAAMALAMSPQFQRDYTQNNGWGTAVFNTLNAPYREAVNRPLGTYMGVGRRAFEEGSLGAFTDADNWREAYNETERVSVGQQTARVGGAAATFLLSKQTGAEQSTIRQVFAAKSAFEQERKVAALSPTATPEERAAAQTSMWDLYANDDDQMLEAFAYDPYLKFSSGSMDFASQLLLDPVNLVGGAVVKTARAGTVLKDAEQGTNALKLLNGETLEGVNRAGRREAQRAAKGIEKITRSTDNMTRAQLLDTPWARSTNDASAVAALFDDANQITDDAARWAAKRDIMAIGLGDRDALTSLAENQAWLKEVHARLVSPIEHTDAPVWKQGEFGGEANLAYWNSPARLKENEDLLPQITDELTRMEGLRDIALSTDRIGATGWERIGAGVREKVYRRSAMSRPVRLVTAPFSRMAPGYVNTKDVTKGADQLRDSLRRSKYLDADAQNQIVANYLGATTSLGRSQALENAEKIMYRAHVEARGLQGDAATVATEALANMAKHKRNHYIKQFKTRIYSAADNAPIRIVDEDGLEHAVPLAFLKTHILDGTSFTDPRVLERALTKLAPSGALQRVDAATMTFRDTSEAVINAASTGWKDLALFRGAYPIRIQVDTQLRLMAAMRGQYLTTAATGVKNFMYNNTPINAPDVVKAAEQIRYADQLERAERAYTKILDEEPETIYKLADIGPSSTTVDPAWVKAHNKRLDDARAEVGRLTQRANMAVPKKRQARKKVLPDSKKVAGTNGARYRGVNINPIQSRQDREYTDRLLQTDNAIALAGQDVMDATLKDARLSGNWEVVTPGAPNWGEAYLRAVNQQLRNSPTAMRMLQGGKMKDIRASVLADDKMMDEWRFAKSAGNDDLDAWLFNIQGEWDHLLTQPGLRETLLERSLNADDLKRFFGTDASKMPTVHGEGYSVAGRKNPALEEYSRLRNWWYRVMADLPEQTMGRHPLYVNRFQERMKSQLDRFGAQGGDDITPEILDVMRRNASNGARKDISKVLFDLSGEKTNLAHALRFVSPFYSAWEDTMLKWGRMLTSDPRNATTMAKVWTAPDKAGLTTTDQNGNKVVIIPKRLNLIPGIGDGRWKIRKDSFNLIFQGSQWYLPGFGPLVQVPSNELGKRLFPDLADSQVGKFLLPYGVEEQGFDSQLLPAWIKRARSAMGGDDADYAGTYAMLYAQEYSLWQNGERKSEPDKAEIKRKTTNWYIARAFGANIMPFSATPSPELQFYIDKAREYRNAKGDTWQEDFYTDFPNFFAMSISLSANTSGIVATDAAYQEQKKYEKELAANPSMGWYLVGAKNVYSEDPNSDEFFSQGVYAAQQANSIPGTNTKYRDKKDPDQAFKAVREQQGWIDYNKGMTHLKLQLEERGLTSFQSKGAEDLKEMKTTFTEELKAENVEWGDAYGASTGGNAVEKFFRQVDKYTSENPKLLERSDNQALISYIEGRRYMQGLLAQRKSSNIENPANADLLEQWNAFNSELVASDVGFEQIWNRVLERDDLSGDL